MTIDEIITSMQELPGVLIVRPEPGDGSPEIAWGDVFCYYAPNGVVSATEQPFATVVIKDYPDDERSRLDRDSVFRVNLAVGKEEFVRLLNRAPRDPEPQGTDPSIADKVIAHPVYGELGWVAVVGPGLRSEAILGGLLRTAHGMARQRWLRRAAP